MAQVVGSIRLIGRDEKTGSPIFPITHTRAVRNEDGTTLETILSQKQDALTSGTTIKTINDVSILGSGNLNLSGMVSDEDKAAWNAKQDALVSGTTIKTINGDSILGSGNMDLVVDTSSCEQLTNKVTTVSSESTDTEYPTAKCVFDYMTAMLQHIVSYPVFEINSNMHLTISSPDASALSLFSVNSSGHLLMTI